MTETMTKPPAGFWNQSHPLAAKQEELFRKLVPSSGEANTAHGELLRAVTRIYYDVYNNGLGNGPFSEEVATLRRFQSEVVTRMEEPGTFESLMRAVAPRGAEWGDLHIRDLSTWPHAVALDDLMAAVVTYVDERVTFLESAGQQANAVVALLPPDHPLAPVEAALAEKHLGGRHAQSLAGELFRAMRALAQALEVKGAVAPEQRYELTLLVKFAPELDVDTDSLNTVYSSLHYHMDSGTPVPPMSGWVHAGAFAQVCDAVVQFAGRADSIINDAR